MRRLPWWVSVLIVLFLFLGQRYGWFEPAVKQAQTGSPGLYRVVHVDDGDTMVVNMNGSEQSVRFIGVDTPETSDPRKNVQCYGYEASDYTKRLLSGKEVRLEADPLNTNRDRYNRLLRYVYLPDGTLVNAELIKRGYGFAYVSFPFTKSTEFTAYQAQAQAAKLGVWSACQPAQNEYGGYTSSDAT